MGDRKWCCFVSAEKGELLINGEVKGSVEAKLAHQLVVALLEFVRRCAKHRHFVGE